MQAPATGSSPGPTLPGSSRLETRPHSCPQRLDTDSLDKPPRSLHGGGHMRQELQLEGEQAWAHRWATGWVTGWAAGSQVPVGS